MNKLADISNEALWQSVLQKELKSEDIARFLGQPLAEGGTLPLLAQSSTPWFDPCFRRAALSLTWTHESDVRWEKLAEWVEQGVWDFILDPFLLDWDDARLKRELAEAASFLADGRARLWVCHDSVLLPPNAFRVIGAHEVIARGGHAAHELGFLLDQLISWAQTPGHDSIAVAVTMDREYFKSIAKKRALKAMAEAAFREMECVEQLSRVTWLARVGWRDFTAYDSANNILRNANALAAGYISGAGVVESLPYDLIAELPLEEHQRAQRLTLTTQLVLQQESMLGEVADPASGGFLLEHLTRTLGEQGWAVMQKLQALPPAERAWALGGECDRHWEGLQKKFRTRRLVQTGVNDFPDAHEALHIRRRWLKDDHVRLGRSFEELRQALKRPVPAVAIAVVGDYAALQARLNFTRNYFELLGLSVCDSGVGMSVSDARAWLERQSAAITAWVAKDEDHVHCLPVGERCYLAGKSAQEGCHNIHAGQDVLAVLEALVLWWGGRP